MKPLVLVLEDSLTERLALRTLLTSAGCIATGCGTLQLARDTIRRRAFDLAILDVLLPDGNGSELMAQLKGDPATAHMAVIMVSSTAAAVTPPPSGQRRADAYVRKPYETEVLTDLIKELMWSSMGGKRYLLVDDSPTFLHALGQKLQEADNEVVIAKSGEEALKQLEQHLVDCVVIDMVMPGMGGLLACQRIRALPAHKQVPIVMLTASENLSERSQGQTVGADEFLIKQADLDLLCAQLRSIVRKAALRPWRKSDSVSIPMPSSISHQQPKGLYEQVLALTGLSHWVARLVVSRACSKLGIVPQQITRAQLRLALSAIHDNLLLFVPRADADLRLASLTELAGTWEG